MRRKMIETEKAGMCGPRYVCPECGYFTRIINKFYYIKEDRKEKVRKKIFNCPACKKLLLPPKE